MLLFWCNVLVQCFGARIYSNSLMSFVFLLALPSPGRECPRVPGTYAWGSHLLILFYSTYYIMCDPSSGTRQSFIFVGHPHTTLHKDSSLAAVLSLLEISHNHSTISRSCRAKLWRAEDIKMIAMRLIFYKFA